ncbi:hypothetical protein [Streptomyces sp. NPDC091268]|uniref:hypothetical protein n=1 Tax=Streptomyces sp. NPDC091268 TaxID=3365979 RepID=UPI0038067630
MEISWHAIETVPRYPYPWRVREFFECMPEALNGEPPTPVPTGLDPAERFDLVIIGWQVWFLSPSLPIQAFFTAAEAVVLRGTRVISVTCCREICQRAQARMRMLIRQTGGVLTDSIVLTHQGGSMVGYLTAPRLMLSGRREAGALLPAAGVAQHDIDGLARFGVRLRETQNRWAEAEPGSLLADLAPTDVNTSALLPEMIGAAVMTLFARVARRCGRPGGLLRLPVIGVFMLALVILLPVVLAVSALLTPVLRILLPSRFPRRTANAPG